MHYVVIDLEWNQAMSSKSSVFNRLPIHLRGEIIQIGAVKLNADWTPGEEFQADVKPVYFRQMHYKVKKLTGIDKERLSHGIGFKEAMEKLRAWCGDDCTFLTWGYDDRGIMEQNIIIHDLDWDWIHDWINLQLIYNVQEGGDKNQKALKTAMEHFNIEQTRVAHDALGDAYNTALVCSHMDMETGLARYKEAPKILAARLPAQQSSPSGQDGPPPISRDTFNDYPARAEAFKSSKLATVFCPECGESISVSKWINQGDRRYMALSTCPNHGKFLIRVKFKKAQDETWSATRLLYRADEDMENYYRTKAGQSRRRRRHRGGKGKNNTKTKAQ